jgi:hypothetical protein
MDKLTALFTRTESGNTWLKIEFPPGTHINVSASQWSHAVTIFTPTADELRAIRDACDEGIRSLTAAESAAQDHNAVAIDEAVERIEPRVKLAGYDEWARA